MSDLTRYKVPTKSEFQKRQLATQIEVTKIALQPSSKMIDGLIEITELIDMFFNYLEGTMDKKMHQVTKRMETAEKDADFDPDGWTVEGPDKLVNRIEAALTRTAGADHE